MHDEHPTPSPEEQGLLASLPFTREQALLTGGALLTSGIIDLATHFESFWVFAGLAGTLVVSRHGTDILEYFRPGRHGNEALEATMQLVEAMTDEDDLPRDQSALAKLKRLVGMPSERVLPPKGEAPLLAEGEEEPEDEEERREEAEDGNMIEPLQRKAELTSGVQGTIIGPDPALRLDLAPTFQPDANAMLSTGVFAVGCSGSGKTVTLVRIVEQYIKRYQLPCLILDSQGDFKSLVEDGFCPHGILATPENLPSMQQVIAHRLQVVVDLDAWHEPDQVGLNWEMAAKLTATLIADLMREQRHQMPEERMPCLVVIDEVHLFVPQGAPSYLTPKTAKTLLDTVIALSTTGRKLHVVPFLATQRIARVNKDVIGSMETRLFGKADLDNDLARYREYIDERVVSNEQIRAFRPGEMVVCFFGSRILARFHYRETRHVSQNPRIPMGNTGPVLPPEVSTPRVRTRYHSHGVGPASTAERRKEREWRLQGIGAGEQLVGESEAATVSLPPTYQKQAPHIPTLSEVLAAFPEHKPRKRDIQKHFGITDYQAYKLYQQLSQGVDSHEQRRNPQ